MARVLRTRARTTPGAIAYTYLADGATDARSISWLALDASARALAQVLVEQDVRGCPVLLALPSGLAFIEALFACWYAGAIAVPLSVPRHRRVRDRLGAIIADCGAHIALGAPETGELLGSAAEAVRPRRALRWIDPRVHTPATSTTAADLPDTSTDGVALLQYTSGSTGTPRGVIVTHANLLHNSALIAEACSHSPGETIGGWLPLFHDMGLIGLIVQAAASGLRCVFMSPERFLMRPALWLRMISRYRLCSSPAPNFAYDLCAEKTSPEDRIGLDLSCWRNALNGSEPVRVETLDRFSRAFESSGFRSSAFLPCYGLAESTLLVTACRERCLRPQAPARPLPTGHTPRKYVSCGAPGGDMRLSIVDPDSRLPARPGRIGEIWVSGASVAAGYHRQPDSSEPTFRARMAVRADHGWPQPLPDATTWLRTGDLGFVAEGQLFITGRLRETIIIAGRNHFAADIESTVEAADPAIALSGVAAFATEVDGGERLVVAAELRRARNDSGGSGATAIDAEAIRQRIRAAVAIEHEVHVHDVALLRPGAIPRTSSGKLRRFAARAAYLEGTLDLWESRAHVCET